MLVKREMKPRNRWRVVAPVLLLFFLFAPSAPSGTRVAAEEEPYGGLAPFDYRALRARPDLLRNAVSGWLLKNDGLEEDVALSDVSEAGFFPFWMRDPLTGEPVRILREGDPTGTEISYWPDQDRGWNFTLIWPGEVASASATADFLEAANLSASLLGMTREKRMEGGDDAGAFSQADWDVMMWGLGQALQVILDTYVPEHGSLPNSFHDLLSGRYFINEDFLTRAAELIKAGQSARYECGVIPAENMLYFDFVRTNGYGAPHSWQYQLGPDGYELDTLDLRRLGAVPQDAERIVLLTDEMLADPDSWLPSEDRVTLSEFYNPE